MLKLPKSARMSEAVEAWGALQASLRAEAMQIKNAAGSAMTLSAADLRDFDSSALSLLLSARRLSVDEGVELKIVDVPAQLQELARVYGVADLLWPVSAPL